MGAVEAADRDLAVAQAALAEVEPEAARLVPELEALANNIKRWRRCAAPRLVASVHGGRGDAHGLAPGPDTSSSPACVPAYDLFLMWTN